MARRKAKRRARKKAPRKRLPPKVAKLVKHINSLALIADNLVGDIGDLEEEIEALPPATKAAQIAIERALDNLHDSTHNAVSEVEDLTVWRAW